MCELVCKSTPVGRGVLVFTWQPIRKGSDAGGSRGARAADMTLLQSGRERERQKGEQENHRQMKGWDRNRETNERLLSWLLHDHRSASVAGSTVNKCKHAVKMSQCPCGLGKCAFDYEMCLPSAHYKSSDTGLCLCRALLVPAQSQSPQSLFKVTSSSLCPPSMKPTDTYLVVKWLS